MKWLLKWLLLMGFVVLLFVLFPAQHHEGSSGTQQHLPEDAVASGASSSPPRIVLSKEEHAALIWLLADDKRDFAQGRASYIGDRLHLQHVTSREVGETYARNEVAGDKAYKGDTFFVTGEIDRILSGIGDEAIVVLEGADAFNGAHMEFKGDQSTRIARRSKGEMLNLVCKGAGAIVGSPQFSDCEFADDVGRYQIQQRLVEITSTLATGERPSQSDEQIIIWVVAMAKQLKAHPECSTLGMSNRDLDAADVLRRGQQDALCFKAVRQPDDRELKAAIADLVSRGLDLSRR